MVHNFSWNLHLNRKLETFSTVVVGLSCLRYDHLLNLSFLTFFIGYYMLYHFVPEYFAKKLTV